MFYHDYGDKMGGTLAEVGVQKGLLSFEVYDREAPPELDWDKKSAGGFFSPKSKFYQDVYGGDHPKTLGEALELFATYYCEIEVSNPDPYSYGVFTRVLIRPIKDDERHDAPTIPQSKGPKT